MSVNVGRECVALRLFSVAVAGFSCWTLRCGIAYAFKIVGEWNLTLGREAFLRDIQWVNPTSRMESYQWHWVVIHCRNRPRPKFWKIPKLSKTSINWWFIIIDINYGLQIEWTNSISLPSRSTDTENPFALQWPKPITKIISTGLIIESPKTFSGFVEIHAVDDKRRDLCNQRAWRYCLGFRLKGNDFD